MPYKSGKVAWEGKRQDTDSQPKFPMCPAQHHPQSWGWLIYFLTPFCAWDVSRKNFEWLHVSISLKSRLYNLATTWISTSCLNTFITNHKGLTFPSEVILRLGKFRVQRRWARNVIIFLQENFVFPKFISQGRYRNCWVLLPLGIPVTCRHACLQLSCFLPRSSGWEL